MNASSFLRRSATVAALATVALSGCAKNPDGLNDVFGADTDGATDGGPDDGGPQQVDDGGDDDDGGDGAAPVPNDTEPPHARGIITLGETVSATTVTGVPYINATFVPDYVADEGVQCGAEIDGCFVAAVPTCATPCEYGETCTFGDACQAVCQAPCDLACAAGEECYFPLPGVPGCKQLETFDAGTLSFSGTTVPVTLYPPYVLPPGVTDPLSIPGSDVTVTASGAVGAGLDAFTATMTTAPPLVADLETLTTGEAFGTQAMPLSWVAGAATDQMHVVLGVQTATGTATVQCKTADTGSFAVPRTAINSAIGVEEPLSMTVTLERRSSTLTKGLQTKGELLEQTVQAAAWVELVSASATSTSVAACGVGQSACGTECISTDYDELNCGECGNVCDVGETCDLGVCGGATTGGDGGGGACCVASASPGCADAAVQACVCAVDSYCCATAWDSSCVTQVTTSACGVC